jgi:mRNA interferase RelE/StbE
MAHYEIEFEPSAFKSFNKLNTQAQRMLQPVIEALASDPRPAGCEKLEGMINAFRVRKGDYRIVYTVDDANDIVTVTRVRHRKDAYRRF